MNGNFFCPSLHKNMDTSVQWTQLHVSPLFTLWKFVRKWTNLGSYFATKKKPVQNFPAANSAISFSNISYKSAINSKLKESLVPSLRNLLLCGSASDRFVIPVHTTWQPRHHGVTMSIPAANSWESANPQNANKRCTTVQGTHAVATAVGVSKWSHMWRIMLCPKTNNYHCGTNTFF